MARVTAIPEPATAAVVVTPLFAAALVVRVPTADVRDQTGDWPTSRLTETRLHSRRVMWQRDHLAVSGITSAVINLTDRASERAVAVASVACGMRGGAMRRRRG